MEMSKFELKKFKFKHSVLVLFDLTLSIDAIIDMCLLNSFLVSQ